MSDDQDKRLLMATRDSAGKARIVWFRPTDDGVYEEPTLEELQELLMSRELTMVERVQLDRPEPSPTWAELENLQIDHEELLERTKGCPRCRDEP